eukprot:g3337.t1
MSSREKRAAALAEKKAKLAALKAKHAARKAAPKTNLTASASSTAKNEQNRRSSAEDINRFVDDILAAPVPGSTNIDSGDIGASTLTSTPNVPASAANGTTDDSTLSLPTQSNEQTKQAKYAALTLTTSVSVVHLPGRQVDLYDKGTQTDSTEDSGTKGNNVSLESSNSNDSNNKVRQARSPRSPRTRRKTITSRIDDQSSSASTTSSNNTFSSKTTDNISADKLDYDTFLKNAKRILETKERSDIEQSEPYSSFLTTSTSIVERILNQSEHGYDPTVLYGGTKQDDDDDRNNSDSKVVKIREFYHERVCNGRSVTDLAWSPHYKELFLTAMGARDLQRRTTSDSSFQNNLIDSDGMVLVWSVNRHQTPEFIFRCQSPVTTAKFDPFSPNLIVGATFSGQVVLWDKRAKSQPVQRTPLSASGHTHPVFSLDVVGSTNANKLVTISTDGKMCSWSLGALSEPTDSKMLSSTNKSEVAVTSMSFAAGDSNEFCAGAENGCIYAAQVHGQNKVKKYEGHFGPITSLMFHPGHQLSKNGNIGSNNGDNSIGVGGNSGRTGSGKNVEGDGATSNNAMTERELSSIADHSGRAKSLLLSSSVDWTVKLWSHQPRNGEQPLREVANFRSARDYVYDVRWSPVHPGMFAYVDGGGLLHVWDVNSDMEEPVIKIQVTDGCAAVKIRFTGDGKSLIVGDSTGITHYFNVKENTSLSRANAWIKLSKLNVSE